MTSTPTSRNERCSRSTASGRVTTSISLQPSKGRSAEIVGVKFHELEVGTGRAVVDEDVIVQSAQVRIAVVRSCERRSKGVRH